MKEPISFIDRIRQKMRAAPLPEYTPKLIWYEEDGRLEYLLKDEPVLSRDISHGFKLMLSLEQDEFGQRQPLGFSLHLPENPLKPENLNEIIFLPQSIEQAERMLSIAEHYLKHHKGK